MFHIPRFSNLVLSVMISPGKRCFSVLLGEMPEFYVDVFDQSSELSSSAEFDVKFRDIGAPCIIKGLAADWPCMT